MYNYTIHLNNGDVVKVITTELPQLSETEPPLLHFTRANGTNTTFVIDNVAYFTTKQGA